MCIEMNDRIKLAEAVGWTTRPNEPNGEPVWFGPVDEGDGPYYLYELPDPFTDANDDYAVLEWARNEGAVIWLDFSANLQEVGQEYSAAYGIGDYARAALKALK